jgi:hypothetical protein
MLSGIKASKAKLRPGQDIFLAVLVIQPFVDMEVHPLTF